MISRFSAWFFPALARFLALCAFAFWQGGFVFYAGVVVPIGADELGDTVQGFITRRVTQGLNLAGATALGLWMLDGLLNPPRGRRVGALLGVLIFLVILQGLLFWLHPKMDQMLDPATISVEDRPLFRVRHKVYLWTSTFLWLGSLAWLWLAVISPARGRDLEWEK